MRYLFVQTPLVFTAALLFCSNCAAQSFTVTLNSSTQESRCSNESIERTVSVGQVMGFTGPVQLSASGIPAPAATGFSVNPVNVNALPGTSAFTVNANNVVAGDYAIQITGTAGNLIQSVTLPLFVANQQAGPTTLLSPVSGGSNIPTNSTFTWSPNPQAFDYRIVIALDAALSQVVETATTRATSFQPTQALPAGRTLWWAVYARNACVGSPEDGVIFQGGFEDTGGSTTGSLVQNFNTQ